MKSDQDIGDATIIHAAAEILWERYHDHGQAGYVRPATTEDALFIGQMTGFLLRLATELEHGSVVASARSPQFESLVAHLMAKRGPQRDIT